MVTRYSTTLTPFSLLTFLRVQAWFVCFPRIFFKLQSHRRLFPSPSDLEAWSLGRPMGHYSLLTFLRVPQLGLFVSHEFSSNFKVIPCYNLKYDTVFWFRCLLSSGYGLFGVVVVMISLPRVLFV